MAYYVRITWPRIALASFALICGVAVVDSFMPRYEKRSESPKAFLQEKNYKKAARKMKYIAQSSMPQEEKARQIMEIPEEYGYDTAMAAALSLKYVDVENREEFNSAMKNLADSLYASGGINPNSEYSIEAQMFGAAVNAAFDRYDPLRLRKRLPQAPGPTAEEMLEQKRLDEERKKNPALDAYMEREGKAPDARQLDSFRRYPQGAIPEDRVPYRRPESLNQPPAPRREPEPPKGREAYDHARQDARQAFGSIFGRQKK